MNVKEFLTQFKDKQILYRTYIELYPLFEDYEEKALPPKQVAMQKEAHRKLFFALMDRIEKTELIESNDVLFVVRMAGMFFGEPDNCNSFRCEKQELYEKAQKGHITVWNGEEEDVIKHYAYDMSPLNEVLSMEIFVRDVDNMEAACEIIENITFFGMTEESKEDRVQEIVESLKSQVEAIENGTMETIPAEEVFKNIREEIFESASEEERELLLKEEEEHKKNEKRDSTYCTVAASVNHMYCIQAILEYYRQKVLSGEVELKK